MDQGPTDANCLSCSSGKLYQPDNNTCGSGCKTSQYINGTNCTPCDKTCSTCSGGTAKDCKSCSVGYFYQNQCLTQCPDQYYPDQSDKSAQTCKQCNSVCFNCNGPNQNQCTQCTGDLYLNPGNLCLKTCPDGQFQNSANNKCEPCDSNCKTCSTAKNNCISCNTNQFLDTDGVCKSNCPPGKWTNTTTKKCELCDSNCKSCDVTSKSNCTSCNSPQFLDKTSSLCVNTCPSKYFGNQSTQICEKCDTTCQECTGQNSNQCTKCSGSLYLDANKCVPVCQPGKFSNKSTNNCDLCDQSQCKECVDSSTKCTKCDTNLYLNNDNTCQSSCPKGYFTNSKNGKCDQCDPNCETCFGPNSDQCTNCKGNLYFDSISLKCVEKCPQKYYANNQNNQCMECDKSCLECTGSLKSQCTKCPDQIILFNNQCISNCPDKYFKDPNTYSCIQCDSSCYNCTDNSPNSCTVCQGDLFLTPSKQCKQDCPDGTYKDNNICKKCDSSCLTCSGPEKTNCLKCQGETYFEDNQCKSECNNGWKNQSNNTCDACNSKCSKCNGPDENNCKECPNGTFLNILDNTCGNQCPTNYYTNSSNNKCTKCDSTCKNCSDSGSDKCTECEGTLFLKDGKYCSSNCNDNEFGDQATNKCESCDSKCKTCQDSADKCTSCNSGTYLNVDQCETSCPDSTFKNDHTNTCDDCNEQCLTCSGPSTSNCLSCKEGTYLDKSQNTCVSKCPTKQFGDSSTNTCQNCIENCDQCSDNKVCSKCSAGFFLLNNNSCVSQCPTKFFNDSSNQQCTSCSQNCQTCFDSTSNGCLTCVPGTFKNSDNSSCLHDNECPSGKYADTNTQKCESCFSTCSECTGKDENQCKKCIQDKLFYKGECLKDCPSNTYKSDNQCNDCHKSCSTCSGSSQFQCLTCPTGLLQEGSCVDQCVSNYYPATKNGQQVCLQCNDKCSKCNGPDSNNCTECPQSSFMYQSQCVDNCPAQHIYDEKRVCQKCTKSIKNNKCIDECASNEYLDKQTLLCQPCASQCQSCYGPTTNECKQCSDGYFLDSSNNKCSQNCPDKYFPNKQKNLCDVCDPKCNTCSNSGDSSCLSCNSPLVLLEGKCLKDAPEGYYKDKDQFKKCHESCKTCDGPASSDCLSCPKDIFILDKKCYTQCPSTYFKNQTKMECSKCTGLCKECQSPEYCLSCQNNQYAFKGSCLASCDPILTFQDEKQKQCTQCHSSCNSNGCLGPEQGDCINVGASGFDLLIVKILIFKTGLWVFTSGLGLVLDYKNAKSFGKFGQIRPRDKQLSIHVSDNQVKEIIRRERKDIDFQGTQLNINTSPNRRKRNILSRASMIQILPSEQTSANKTAVGDYQEADSPTKKSQINFSSANIQSQLKILPFQNSQNEINHSPTSRSPNKSIAGNQLNFNDFKAKARPVKQSTLARISQGIPTFQNIEDQVSSENRFQQQSVNDVDSIGDANLKQKKAISYPRKFYYTMIGNETLSIITLYDPKRSRLFRSAMLYLKYLALFFMTYISQNNNYGVAALGLLAVIAGKGILQNILSQVGLCLRKAGLLSLVFVMALSGSDIYFWFLPKIQQMSQNLDMKWSFTYILLFSSDFLIIQSLISFINYIVTIRSSFPDDNTCGDKCKANQYIDGNNCTPCDQTCKTCSGGTIKDCKDCSSISNRYFFANQCLSQCPDQYYPDKTSQTCKKCDFTCFNCSGPNQNQCTQCSGDLYLNTGNTCQDSCPNGQYKNSTNNKCESCDSNCATCSTAKNNCISCKTNQFLDTDGVCKGSCPDGKWTNKCKLNTKYDFFFLKVFQSIAKWSCELCDLNCKTCDDASKSNCTSCNSPLFLDKNTKKCVDICPSKFFGNQSNLSCDNCELTCQECTGQNSNQCTKCSDSLFLDVNKCVSVCQPGKFSNKSTNNCDLCDKSQCKECVDSSTNCTKCDTNLYLKNDNTCQASCPKGFYGNPSNGKCDPCNSNCGTCFGPNADQCTNCSGDLFFDPVLKQCVPKCSLKYYANKDNNQCMECDKSCQECSGSLKTECTSCPDKLILFNNQCISNCPDQYFKDPNAYNCIKCDKSCFNCIDDSPNSCNACKGSLFLTPSNQCLEDCPDGTYKDNNICKKCDQSCSTCSGPDKNNCTKCPENTYLEDNQCKQECINGWKNSSNHTCDACNKQCKKCNGPDQNNCLECPAGTFYNSLQNTCGTECPSKFYANTSNNKCDNCDATCKNCSDSGSDQCLECEGQLFLKDGKYCSSSCNDNEYANILNNKCEICDKKCKTCKEKADQCTGCNPGTFLNDGKCQSDCPDSTFKNDKLNTCDKCDSSCLTCSGPSTFECNSCKEGTYLDQNKNSCASQCPSKYFGDNSSNKCLECVENCDVCSDNKKCQKCLSGFFLFYGQCLDQCPEQYFNDKNTQQCSSCSKNCQTCFDSTSTGCLTCIPRTFKNSDNNSCLHETECPSGKYADFDTKKCEPCFSTCAECTGKDEKQCKQCIEGRLFYKGECLKECPSNTFKFENTCFDCHSSCSTCYGGSELKCLTCSTGLLQEGSCVDKCLLNYYASTKNGQQVCLQCNEQCSKCNGPDSNNCTECSSKLFMYQNQCVENCPIFHIYDEKRQCQICNKSIKNNKCVDECGQSEYLDKNTLLCKPCAAQCQTCYGPTTTECKQCSDGYFFDVQKNECKQNCPEKYFPNKQKNLCEECDTKCNTCSNQGDSSCLSCNSPLVLFEGKCLKDAPNGYYKDKEEFKKCKEDCKTCDGPSSNDCLSCQENSFILDKTCHKHCPSTYFNNEKIMQCTKCSGLCKDCQSPDYCLSCQNNQYAHKGTCVASCDIIFTFQDENLKQCVQCHSTCNSNGCLGPEEGDCINVGASGFDLLIVKILMFKTILWILSSIIGSILDYKNSKSIGKFGQIRPSKKQLSIHVSDQQVRDIIRREKQDIDFQGTQLNVNTSPNRKKRNLKVRTSMISMLPSTLEQTDVKQSGYGEFQEAESPSKKSITNFSSVNIQSQLQMLPYQHSSNDISNVSPTSRTPDKNAISNENNLNDFKITARPIIKQPTLPKMNEAVPTFQNMEEQAESVKHFQNESSKDIDSESQVKVKGSDAPSYPRKLYFTIIGNEIISIITIYDQQRSRLFRSSMLYLKYLALLFMTYVSSKTNYGVAVVGLLTAIAFKGTIQHILSKIGLCLRKAGLLSLVFVMIITGTDIGLWFVPKVQKMSQNLDMQWSFTYILLFTFDILIIQSLISFVSYIITVRSNFVENSQLKNAILNFLFEWPALLQNKN
ncbi:hypothetical protein ABPG74_015001 [Tetrahymena malaccensis]